VLAIAHVVWSCADTVHTGYLCWLLASIQRLFSSHTRHHVAELPYSSTLLRGPGANSFIACTNVGLFQSWWLASATAASSALAILQMFPLRLWTVSRGCACYAVVVCLLVACVCIWCLA